MTIFLLGVFEDRLELVKLILSSAMNKSVILRQKDIYNNHALHLAVLGNSAKMIEYLLQQGVDPSLKNEVIIIII